MAGRDSVSDKSVMRIKRVSGGEEKASGRDVMNIICYMSESSSTRETLIVATVGEEPLPWCTTDKTKKQKSNNTRHVPCMFPLSSLN
jgi:hypothetical protein